MLARFIADDAADLHIPLKQEWDYSPHFDDDKYSSHCHVTRKKEQEMLVDFIQRKNEGALLLSGKRGVGKTSAIFSAIQEAKRLLKKDNRILPVLVNAPNFEIGNPHREKAEQIDLLEFKRLVLQTLVRRLYEAAVKRRIINIVDDELVSRHQIGRNTYSNLLVRVKDKIRKKQKYDKLLEEERDNDIKKRIHSLYRRAVAKEVRQVTNLKQLEQEKYRLEREKNFQVKLELVGTTVVSFLVAILTALYPLTQIEVVNRILSVLIGTIPPAVAISWQVRKTLTDERDIEKEASIYYLHDYNISTLQSELEETLRKLLESNYKVIFIIDELDKIEEEYVIEVIKSLKVLFNQGSSLFILVTGQEFFNYVINHSEDRGTEYTLFPQKIFLTRPQMEEVQVFVNKIVDTEYLSARNGKLPDEYQAFINYACYVSKSDFFDLYRVLRDHIAGYNSNRPTLDIHLNRVQRLQANFQKAMAQVYFLKQYHHLSDWNKNDLLLDKMYQLLDRLTKYRSGYEFVVDTKVPFNIIFKKESSEELDILPVPDIIEAGSLTDLIVYLTWLNALRQTTENHYQITGNIDKVPDKPMVYTREEINFLDEFKKFQYILVAYVNLYKIYSEKDRSAVFNIENFNQHRNTILEIIKERIGVSLDQPSFNLEQLFSIYEDLSPVPSRHYEREALHDPIKEINAAIDYVSQQFINVIKSILETKKSDFKVRSLSIQELNSELNLHIPSEKMTSMQVKNLLLERQHSLEKTRVKYSENTRRLVIVQNPSIEVAKAIENIDPERKDNYYSVILTTNTSVDNDFMQPLKDNPHIEFVSGLLKKEIPANQRILNALIDVILSWNGKSELRNKYFDIVEGTPDRVWFSHLQQEYQLLDSGYNEVFQWKKDQSKTWDWENCTVQIERILSNGKIRIAIRSKTNRNSDYMGGPVELRFMLGIDINSISEPYVEFYRVAVSNRRYVPRSATVASHTRWVFRLDDRYWIWQWAKAGQDIKSSTIYELYQHIQNALDKYTTQQGSSNIDSNIFKVKIDETFDDIVPVIYQPAVDSLRNFVREVHCAKKINADSSVDVEVSLIFNIPERHKILAKTYERIRNSLYSRPSNVETFRIHLVRYDRNNLTKDNDIDNKTSRDEENNKINSSSNNDSDYFIFEGIYSGEHSIEDDTVHLDDKPPAPKRPIKYYFIDHNHPVVFINTANHAMGTHDNNQELWKWEYIPWVKKSPVKLGEKSRAQIDYKTE